MWCYDSVPCFAKDIGLMPSSRTKLHTVVSVVRELHPTIDCPKLCPETAFQLMPNAKPNCKDVPESKECRNGSIPMVQPSGSFWYGST